MAKSKEKGGKKKPTANIPSQPEIVEPPHIPDIRIISIKLMGYKNVFPMFSSTDVMVSASFLNEPLGESTKVHVTDDEFISAEHEFQIECDLKSPESIDKLITNPIIFTVTQYPGELDEAVKTHFDKPIPTISHSVLSTESAADLLEAFTDEKVDKSALNKNLKLSKSGSKSKGSDTGSKKDSKSKVSEKGKDAKEAKKPEMPTEPLYMGTCLLDIVPLFLGFQMIKESLPILSEKIFYDDRMVPEKMAPHIMVDVKVDPVWIFEGKKSPNLLNFTVESLYNIPFMMTSEMDYKVCIQIPNMTGKFEPVILNDGIFTQDLNLDKFKRWAHLSNKHDLTSSTKYKVSIDTWDVRNKSGIDLEKVLSKDEPRIEWNLLKRNFLLEEAQMALLNHLKKYRHFALEIFMTPAMEDPNQVVEDAKVSKGKGKDKKGKTGGGTIDSPKEFLHLMALVDVSSLLYPGVNSVRVACPVNTFQDVEAKETTGLENSFFMPKKETVLPTRPESSKSKASDKSSAKGGKKASDKGSAKGGKKASDKGSAKGAKGKDEPKDLKDKLPPPPPPPPEPSKEVYNEYGERTFIIVEFELLHPISPKRALEDLTPELEQMIPQKPVLPKLKITTQIATEYYYEVIRQLITDMNDQYQYYLEDVKNCTCKETFHLTHTDFLMFLRRNGVYQTYLSSLTKAASVMVNDSFSYNGEYNKSSNEYKNFIADVFAQLVCEMNYVFSQITMYGLEPPPMGNLSALDKLLLFAREATELSAYELADRYYLERIARDERNAESWFDYAVFRLDLEDFDKAFECVHEALSIDIEHKYSLLLYGILLAEKKHLNEAETCFLTLMCEQPRWVEGWTVFYLFYQELNNQEGTEYCMAMAQKYIQDPFVPTDYFAATDDLAWSTAICPNTIFIRAAMLLIKMRAFTYAEKALSLELFKHSGIVHYLLGAIHYYKSQYNAALLHLDEAEELHGSDFAVGGLKGHILINTGKLDEAKIQYTRILESFDRPHDIHMIYINLAIIHELQNNIQEARQLLLLVCKCSPTAYSWLATGLLYYKQRDLLSAEECLMQSNLYDNRLPETWAYLTIINLQLERYSEAELCYRQTMKNNLSNSDLMEKINKVASNLGSKSSKKNE